MGLFTPAWRGKDPQKRAAAIERMDDRKLLSVIRYYTEKNPDYVPILGDPARAAFDRLSQAALAEVARDLKIGGYLRCEAVKKINDEEVCLAIIRGCSENRSEPECVGTAAVDRLSQAALAGILRDPGIKSALKEKAIRRIDDEKVLLAYLQESSSVFAQRAVLKRLHTGSLILGAVREDRSLFRAYLMRGKSELAGNGLSPFQNKRGIGRFVVRKIMSVRQGDLRQRCFANLTWAGQKRHLP